MDWLLRLLSDNPILLFFVVAWVAGMLGNVAKAAKKARQSQGGAATPRAKPPSAWPADPAANRPRSPDEVAAEIRRALGLDPPAAPARPEPAKPVSKPVNKPVAKPRPVAPPRPASTLGRRPQPAERAPTPVMPTTQHRHLELHADSHVGEALQRRAAAPPPAAVQRSFGGLGGRNPVVRHEHLEVPRRYAMNDVTRAIVMAEILGPPVSMREPRS